MTYHIPDGWRLPRRGPQHAAPAGSRTPLRIQAHRALPLFVAAGAWGAGLCLVIGLVALVAGAAVPSRPTRVAATTRGYGLRLDQQVGRGRHDPADGSRGTVLGIHGITYAFRGSGDTLPGPFWMAAHSRWELQWSYRCRGARSRGHLIIREADAAAGVSVDAAGSAGRGGTWTYSDVSRHYLVILGNCPWTVRVTGRR